MPENLVPEDVESQARSLFEQGWSFLQENWFETMVAVVVLAIALFILGRVRRMLRRLRKPKIHTKLQVYAEGLGGTETELSQKRRAEAEKIIATSSGLSIAGYEILRQVEAVSVAGFRRPEDALLGLKATAAMKGGNAVINVRTEQVGPNRFSASGDAVQVRKPGEDPPDVALPEGSENS